MENKKKTQWEEKTIRNITFSFDRKKLEIFEELNGIRKAIGKIIFSKFFQYFINFSILANVVILCFERLNMSEKE